MEALLADLIPYSCSFLGDSFRAFSITSRPVILSVRLQRLHFVVVAARRHYMFHIFRSVVPFLVVLDGPDDMPMNSGNIMDLPQGCAVPVDYWATCLQWARELERHGCCKLMKPPIE